MTRFISTSNPSLTRTSLLHRSYDPSFDRFEYIDPIKLKLYTCALVDIVHAIAVFFL